MYGSRHIADFFKRPYLAAAACVSLILALAVAAPSPVYADDYSDLSKMLEQAREMRDNIVSARNEYLSAVQQSEQMEAQIKDAQAELEGAEGRLARSQDRLSEIAVASYKYRNSIIDSIVSAPDFSSLLSQLEYYNRISEEQARIVSDMEKTRNELAQIPPKLEAQKIMAQENAAAAMANKELFESELAAIQPRISEMRSEFKSRLHELDGADQLNEIISYLSNAGNVTESQVEIVHQAYQTPYAGGNLCESWAESVYRNAGFDVPNLESAWESWSVYGISEDKENIPVGAFVYGSGTSVPYSHVGILVAEGMVLDNEAAASGHTAVPLDQWLSWQTAVSSNNGQSGWFGWGHPDWIEFSGV